MSTRKWKLAAVLLWGGAGLVLLGLVLAYPRLVALGETYLYTPRIPTAPPLVITPTPLPEPVATATPSPEPTQEIAPTATATSAELEDDPPTATASLTPTATSIPTATPTSTPRPAWTGTSPVNVSIPSIQLDAPVVEIGWIYERVRGREQAIWDVPDYRAAGWHRTSARLGVPGNTVLNGHNTANGEVFRYLYRVEVGSEVQVEGEDGAVYVYRVGEKYILREAGQPLEVRLQNARYIQQTPDERLTLVTCHPYGSLANRLILIAYPVRSGAAENGAS